MRINARNTGINIVIASLLPAAAFAAPPVCEIRSGDRLTPVIELYTSEGCSSCPPAEQWLSSMKGKPVVAQAFHVAYWDYIGWKDRFADPTFTARQKQVSAANSLSGIYTPQIVRNGRDWRQWREHWQSIDFKAPASAAITLRNSDGRDRFEARVTPGVATVAWTAYWTVTENNHSSHVKAGENSGEYLKHDFVVRQYAQVGRYQGSQSLKFYAIASQPDHPRQINLIVSNLNTGEPMQAVSLPCS